MTDVLVNLMRPGRNGALIPSKGQLSVRLVQRQRVGDALVTIQSFEQVLDGGMALLGLVPTTAGLNAWQVTESVPGGTIRTVQVPDSSTQLKYADLTDVDPRSLQPTTSVVAAWKQIADDVAALKAQGGSGGAAVVDQGDGYYDVSGSSVVDQGDGYYQIGS